MKKIIMAGLFCLSLLMVPAGASQVQASQASATTEFVYRGTSSTVIDRGPGVSGGGEPGSKDRSKSGYRRLPHAGIWLRSSVVAPERSKEKIRG